MSDPKIGLAKQDWQYGGLLPPAPTVLMGRMDQIDFQMDDWALLDDFEMEMLDEGPREVTPRDFTNYVKNNYLKNKECNLSLGVFYPK